MSTYNFTKISKYWHYFILIPLAITLFLATSSFNYYTQSYSPKGDFVKWVSPDETANYIFAKLYGQTGQLSFEEKYNRLSDDVMHPRSIRSDHGYLKPVSFLGLPIIYGKIVSWTNYRVLPFLTPAFAAIGLFFYYLLVKKIFNKNIALVSALLLSVFPVYLYFSARSMFHNVLFTVFLIIGFYFLAGTADNQKKARYSRKILEYRLSRINWPDMLRAALGGLFVGLAITVRTSELLWLAPLLLFLWLFNIRRLGITKPLLIVSFIALAVLPMVYYNQILYQSWYFGGYGEMNQSIITIRDSGVSFFASTFAGQLTAAKDMAKRIFDTVFYFGFKPRQSLRMFYYYYIQMFPVFFSLSALGLAVFIAKWRRRRRQWIYLAAWAIVSAVLVFYYGSWRFFDNPDKTAHTIGNSYTRYWLPLYLGALPLAGLFLCELAKAVCALFNEFKDRWQRLKEKLFPASKRYICEGILAFLLVIPIGIRSVNFALYAPDEGLVALAGRQIASQAEWQRVLDLTEKNAVIITQYHDKLFFPERKVIVGLFDDPNMIAIYARVADYLPVYYYNFTFPEKDLEYLNTRRLKEYNLEIDPVDEVAPGFTLYRLFKVNETANNDVIHI